jgi:hypothetical protein
MNGGINDLFLFIPAARYMSYQIIVTITKDEPSPEKNVEMDFQRMLLLPRGDCAFR